MTAVYESVLNLDKWSKICHLKIFLFLALLAILFDRESGTVCAILVVGIKRNIHV